MIKGIFSNLTSGSRKKDNIEQIGDNIFIFNLTLFNGTAEVGIKFSAVEDLQIVDDLRFFYVYGTLTINYNNDVLEAFESLGSSIGTGSSNTAAYQFRGDGRDILKIDIMPQIKEQKCLQVYASESERKKFNIKHECCIYKYEDITSSKGNKQRKFYFWDRDYQILNDVTIDYSTGDKTSSGTGASPKGGSASTGAGAAAAASNPATRSTTKNTPQADKKVSNSNTENSVPTSQAMEDILNKALVQTSGRKFVKGMWDTGESKIMYYSTSSNKAVQDLAYVLSLHISDKSNNNLPCLLKKERYTDKYDLKPLNKYYSGGSGLSIGTLLNANDQEDFYIGKIDPSSSGLQRGSMGGSRGGKMNISDYNLIDDYTFTKISAKDLQRYLATSIVHSNDPRGFFTSDFKENNFQSATKLYEKTYLKSGNYSTGSSTNTPVNTLRKTHKTINHDYIPDNVSKEQRKSYGVNKGMLNLFFKNTSISFKARGNTMRQTGKFFTINRMDGNISTSYDNTVLGKYMTTYVIHQFGKGGYNNTIHGVKPYVERKQNFTEEV